MKIRRDVITFALTLVTAVFNISSVQAIKAASFTSTGPLATARQRHTATLLPNGKVLVAGGNVGSTYLASAELYDPTTGTWAPARSLNHPRYTHTATLLPNGKVLVAGGYNDTSGYLASAELYDPVTDMWTLTDSLKIARMDATATLLSDGQVLIAGGYGASAFIPEAELYSGTWATTGALNTPRRYHTATLLHDGKVLVTGGMNVGALAKTELYNPATGNWTESSGLMTTPRYAHVATLLPNGNILVAGGLNATHTRLASAEIYTGAWTQTEGMTTARQLPTATLLPNGRVLVAGGFSGSSYLASAEVYDPISAGWSDGGSMTAARYFHTATSLGNGKVLLAAGFNSAGGYLYSAELYDPDPSFVSFLPKDDVIVKYGTLTWKKGPGANDVIFYPKVAFKLEPFTRPVAQGGLGRLPLIAEKITFTQTCSDNAPANCMFTMCWNVADSSLTKAVKDFRVVAVSQEDDWVLCEGTEPYTYAAPGVYEAGFYACRRPLAPPDGDQLNRASTTLSDFGMEVHVRLDTTLPVNAQREKIDMPPVLWVWRDVHGEVRFRVPTAAPGSYVTGLSDWTQAGLDNHGEVECYKPISGGGEPDNHPENEFGALFYDSQTGECRWPLAFTDGDWTVQLQLQDQNAPQLRTMVDFIFRIIPTDQQGKVTWSQAPPQIINVVANNMVNFNLAAQHVGYTGGQFTITSATLPSGAMLIPAAPVTRQNQLSVSTAFAWIPSSSQLGSHIVHFIAGNTALNPADESRAYSFVIINVSP